MDITQGFVWFIEHIFLINILLAILLVFFERKNPTSTWAWLMILFFIPVFGFIVYLMFGQDSRKKKVFDLKQEEEQQLTEMIRKQKEVLDKNNLVLNDPHMESHQDLITFHLKSSGALYSQDNAVDLFYEGNAKFDALLKDIEAAKTYIHIEYYIIRNDELGQKLMAALTEKAREGIEVKLLYDGMGCIRVPPKFFRPLIQAGGRVTSFLPPFLPYVNLRLDYRNHRKICVIDGKSGYIGGLNVGNEYLGLSRKFGFWRDTHLRIAGSAVDQLELRFSLDWKFAAKEEISFDEKYFPTRISKRGTGMQIVSSGPDSKWSAIKKGYFKMITEANDRVYIQTPYFIPDDSIFEALRVAALSGIDVRVIIPNQPDHLFVYWASLSYVGELLKAGVKCYTYQKGFIHSKMILVDGVLSTVGSANLDIRSFKLNFEVNAFIYDQQITQKLEEQYLKDLDVCKEITLEEYHKYSKWIKMKESVSRLLSPIL